MQTKNMQGKYVSVLKGKILDVVLDLRKGSKTFGKHYSILLSEKKAKSIFIPPGFAHGFLVLSDVADVIYKTSSYYNAACEGSFSWNDPKLAIHWPASPLHLSAKDASAPSFAQAMATLGKPE